MDGTKDSSCHSLEKGNPGSIKKDPTLSSSPSGRPTAEVDSSSEGKGQGDMPQSADNVGSGTLGIGTPKKNFLEIACPYCAGKNFVKRGLRKKNNETVQLYLCNDCKKTFTPGATKGKHYSLSVILDAISLYYLGYSLEEAARLASEISEKNSENMNSKKSAFETDSLVESSLTQNSGLSPTYNTTINKISVKLQLDTNNPLDRGGEGNRTPRSMGDNPEPAPSHPHDNKIIPQNIIKTKDSSLSPSPSGRPAPEIDSSFGSEGQDGTIDSTSVGDMPQSADNVGSGTENVGIGTATLFNWVKQYEPLCAFARMRPFAIKMFSPKEMISSATLAHRQLYRFRHHRAKTILITQEDWKHSRFWPLKDFLDLIPVECPHQYFQTGMRASEAPIMFSKTEMIVRGKTNFANKMAKFVLQSVEASKDRHDALQRFMLANDSVTVATEVPIYLRREDLAHMQTQLGFKLYKKQNKQEKEENKEIEEFAPDEIPRLITGHIDFVQIRNGQIHILDYKPNAAKERPIEQLTIYALALSRLTGLKVFNFKCAWFDEKDYFEFFPLHVVYKPDRKRRRKNIQTVEGNYVINENAKRMEVIRPTPDISSSSESPSHSRNFSDVENKGHRETADGIKILPDMIANYRNSKK